MQQDFSHTVGCNLYCCLISERLEKKSDSDSNEENESRSEAGEDNHSSEEKYAPSKCEVSLM